METRMDLEQVQQFVDEHYGKRVARLTIEYGVARLLTQAGQLGDALLNGGDVPKELSDVLFVLLVLAHRSGVKLPTALQKHLLDRNTDEVFARIDRR
jgi:hypothetical protein